MVCEAQCIPLQSSEHPRELLGQGPVDPSEKLISEPQVQLNSMSFQELDLEICIFTQTPDCPDK